MSKQATVKKPAAGGWSARDTRTAQSLTVKSRGGTYLIRRDTKSGSFTSQRSATRIRTTSTRAAESLKRLAKR